METGLRETFHRCLSYNCLASGVCGKDPREPHHVGVWVYVVIAIGIFGGESSNDVWSEGIDAYTAICRYVRDAVCAVLLPRPPA